MKGRLQASGYRLQESWYVAGVALANTGSNGEVLPPDLIVPAAAVAHEQESLNPETCSLMPFSKAES